MTPVATGALSPQPGSQETQSWLLQVNPVITQHRKRAGSEGFFIEAHMGMTFWSLPSQAPWGAHQLSHPLPCNLELAAPSLNPSAVWAAINDSRFQLRVFNAVWHTVAGALNLILLLTKYVHFWKVTFLCLSFPYLMIILAPSHISVWMLKRLPVVLREWCLQRNPLNKC